MKNIKLNKKGYMLIEIVIASVIALVMAYFLIEVTVKLVNKNNDYYIDSILLADKNIITKEIMDDINSKKLIAVNVEEGSRKSTLTFDDDTVKVLSIVEENDKTMISYGDYKKEISDKLKIEKIVLEIINNNILSINIPAYTNYSKTNYGITVSVPYNNDIEITYPNLPDLLINNITLDKNKVNKFPDGSYIVDLNCSGADATYDYLTKKIIVSNINVEQKAICSPNLTSITRTTFANKIISLLNGKMRVASTSNNDGSTLEKITKNGEEDYRYRGIDPNNYVLFNDELWRIIGVFDEESHGIKKTHLVKIIRNDSIGSYLWEKRIDIMRNNYPGSDIYQLLNTAYYNAINATGEEYCYGEEWLPKKCNFTRRGIQEKYRKMVEYDVNWFLGGSDSSDITSDEMYKRERNGKVQGINATSTKEVGADSPIGLIYASDYGYAASSSCTSNLCDYNTPGCADNNWLKSNRYEYTITQRLGSYIHVWGILNTGDLYIYGDVAGTPYYDVRPVLYLKSDVYYLSGEGTQEKPYIISIDK